MSRTRENPFFSGTQRLIQTLATQPSWGEKHVSHLESEFYSLELLSRSADASADSLHSRKRQTDRLLVVNGLYNFLTFITKI